MVATEEQSVDYVTVSSAKIVQSAGKVNLRDIAFSGGISATILVRLFDMSTGLQVGADREAGPGTLLVIDPTTVEFGQIIEFKYTATTEAEGYSNRTEFARLTTVVIAEDPEVQAYVPMVQEP